MDSKGGDMVGLEGDGDKQPGAAPGEGPVPAAGWRKKWNSLKSGLSKEEEGVLLF